MKKMAFRAKFSGRCAKCGGQIEIGQEISWNRRGARGQRVYHVNCSEPERAPKVGGLSEFSPVDLEEVENSLAEEVKLQEVVTSSAPARDAVGAERTLLQDMAEALRPYLEMKLKSKVDEDRVREIVHAAIEKLGVTRVEFCISEFESVDMGIQHKLFPLLLNACQARDAKGYHLNIWLTGPAGSGKTMAAHNAAEALQIPFYFTGSIDTPYPLLGFIAANGELVRTPFREAYENGGVFLFDEVDSSSPSAVLAFNAALANGTAAFPDGMIARHKDFVCIAAANTWGLGATNDYVGRFKMDAAFLDRFVAIHWEIDEKLEMATCGNQTWCAKVQSVRRKIVEKGIKVVVSPRASYYGAALLAAGMQQGQVEALTLKKAMSTEQWASVGGN